MRQLCTMCGSGTPDGYVCRRCAIVTTESLQSARQLSYHLADKRARRGTNFRPGGTKTKGAARPLPVDLSVSPVSRRARDELDSAVLWLEQAGWTHPHADFFRDTFQILMAAVGYMRTAPDGDVPLRACVRANAELTRLFDNPGQVFLGLCSDRCGEVIYADEGEARGGRGGVVRCPRCDTPIDVAARRREFSRRVKIYQATVKELVNLSPYLLDGRKVSEWKVRELVRRRYLVPVGVRKELTMRNELRSSDTYRMGDLATALARHEKDTEASRKKTHPSSHRPKRGPGTSVDIVPARRAAK